MGGVHRRPCPALMGDASGPVLHEETFETCCEKYKQIFVLRNRTDEGAVPALMEIFHSTGSVLLRHEIAYALGQMQRLSAVSFLTGLLEDGEEDPITRHEAAEALGAIQAPESLAVLERHAADGSSEVSDTCGLALAQLNFQIQKGACGCERRPQEVLRLEAELEAEAEAEAGAQRTGANDERACELPPKEAVASSYTYVSPAPAARAAPVGALRAQLLDGTLPLFERYRALFALRDAVAREGEPAVLQPSALASAPTFAPTLYPGLTLTLAHRPSPSP